MKIKKNIKISNYTILLIILISILILFTLLSKDFRSYNNLISMSKNLVVTGVLALGLTPLMIARGIDVSFGSNLSLTTVVMALLFNKGLNIWAVILIGIGFAILVSSINGFLIEGFNLNPLIYTVGMLYILQSIALKLSNLRGVPLMSNELYWLGTANFLKIPILVWIFILLTIIYWIVLRLTQIGKKIHAIGGSPEISSLAGIKVKKIRIILHIFFGFSIGFASIIIISLAGSGHPYHGLNLPLPIISGVVLGGISFMSAGKGNVWGTVLGFLIVGIILNGLSILNVPSFYIKSFQGVALISVVSFYEIRDRNKKRYIG